MAALTLVILLLPMSAPAMAQVCNPSDVNVGFIDSGAKAAGQCGISKEDGRSASELNDSQPPMGETSDVPKIETRFVRACLEDLDDISISCEILAADCGTDEILLEKYTAPVGPGPAQWQPTGELTCSSAPSTSEEVAEFPGYTLEDFKSLPFTPAGSAIQPSPHTLIGAHTNVYAIAHDQSFSVNIAGFDVRINANPNSYRWSFGDGQGLGPVKTPGAELSRAQWGEETSTSHVYEQTGDFQVVLTTYFTGMYSVDGGPWIPIPGQAAVESAPVTISVWRSETNNYADNCFENPEGAGCQGAGG
ncbi:PKD domain-containing protein [Arthrobacter monumenti]